MKKCHAKNNFWQSDCLSNLAILYGGGGGGGVRGRVSNKQCLFQFLLPFGLDLFLTHLVTEFSVRNSQP